MVTPLGVAVDPKSVSRSERDCSTVMICTSWRHCVLWPMKALSTLHTARGQFNSLEHSRFGMNHICTEGYNSPDHLTGHLRTVAYLNLSPDNSILWRRYKNLFGRMRKGLGRVYTNYIYSLIINCFKPDIQRPISSVCDPRVKSSTWMASAAGRSCAAMAGVGNDSIRDQADMERGDNYLPLVSTVS